MSNRNSRNKFEHFIIVTFVISVTTAWSCTNRKHQCTEAFQTDIDGENMEHGADNDPTCPKRDITSVHSDQIHEVHNVPMEVLIRPFPSVLDESKVDSLMDTIKVM